ncbi:Molybdopterin molybdenumtransferase [Anatilimnocola aggregata]|uniref:Molybdopterin molybdenumtransferase n=1 Tax=Anatilimnocola aggregata TaxID=2528021 RepID=A0A517YEK5_9BACT|nr:gephyrin-like molybdotransferase Glp [Anatilimnocola aggregata]QDU28592.1 Molybdopterin molybdenumtransferase [Anatilimnocola aggregata]
MISVEQALELVLQHAGKLQRCRQVNIEAALGCILAEDVVSDVDSPPHDKSIVDGYAIHEGDLSGENQLQIIEHIVAGLVPSRSLEKGLATQIMTGAPIPTGTAAVVMVEKTSTQNKGDLEFLSLTERSIRPGQNIVRRGQSMKLGDVVLRQGTLLRAIEIGLLAEVGRESVWTLIDPAVAILPTGDEIVPHTEKPPPGKIRNSNSSLLANLVMQAGGQPAESDIVPDHAETLLQAIEENLDCDAILLSGGVSAGVHDLVPAALAKAGVKQVFHHVNLKPGKPLWFGFFDRGDDRPPCLVFGLPGNPVSGLVCFELFVRPALQKMRWMKPRGLPIQRATLTVEHKHRGDRPSYWPAEYDSDSGQILPLSWQGSGDLRSLTGANALAYFPGGDRVWPVDEEVTVYLLPASS